MRRIFLSAWVAALILPHYASGQSYSEVDTLRVVGVDTFQVQGLPVELFFIESSLDEETILFGEMNGYVGVFGEVTVIDTVVYPFPIPWFKVDVPTVGDWWPSILPLDQPIETWDLITGFESMSVGGNPVPVVSMDVNLWEDDSYLGRKWYGDGVGLVGWDVTICNERYTYMLQSWSLTGGSGYWPRAAGNEWIYQYAFSNARVDAPELAITVDGSADEWPLSAEILADGMGDDTLAYTGTDIWSVKAAVGDDNLYIMIQFWDGRPDTAWGQQSTSAYRFEIEEWTGETSAIGVYYDPFGASWEFAGFRINLTDAAVAVDDVIEISVPLANLGWPAELPYVWAQVGNDNLDLDYTCYTTVNLPATCPITTAGDVTGEGNLSTGDIVYLVNLVFKLGPEPLPCMAAGDMDCNGNVTSADVIFLVNKILKAGPDPCDVCSFIPATWTCP